MLLSKEVKVYSNGNNLSNYKAKGYDFTNKEYVMVKVEDLNRNASQNVKVLCDYCLEEDIETLCTRSWKQYNYQRKDIEKDCCTGCQAKKIKDVSQKRYGVDNPSQTKEVIEKIKNTFQNKYGVDNIMYLPETLEKILKTTESKYGYKYILGTEYGQEKFKATNLERYGNEQYFSSDQFINSRARLVYENGTAPCSTQQKYIHNIIGGELNYPVNNSSLDIAFPDEKIYVECDFSGHWMSIATKNISEEEFKIKERKRWYALYNQGWKEIRIISRKDKIPSYEKINEMMIFARKYLNIGHSYIRFDIDENTIKSSQFNTFYNFGKVQTISKQNQKCNIN